MIKGTIQMIPPLRLGFYDPFNVHDKLKDQIASKVVLSNLHWKRNEGDHLRSIPQLLFDLVEEKPADFERLGGQFDISVLPTHDSLNKTILSSKVPYVRLMFIECDNTDTYRSKVRPLIKEWMKSAIDNSYVPLAWIIVYHVVGEEEKYQTRVFEKLKVDFCPNEESGNCLKIKTTSIHKLEENEYWNTLTTKIRAGILSSFGSRLDNLQKNLVYLNSNSSDANNNLFLYLATKEAVANQFLTLHLLEDSFIEYDQLYTLIKKNQRASVFGDDNIGFYDDVPDDFKLLVDQQGILKDAKSNLSLFSALAYVFAKKFVVLYSLAKSEKSLSLSSIHIAEFLKSLELFATDISSVLSSNRKEFYKVQEWTIRLIDYILNLEICKSISEIPSDNEDYNLTQIYERLGSILLLKRSIIVKLGNLFDYSIEGIFREISFMDDESIELKPVLVYDPLILILASYDMFEENYLHLTEQIVKYFSVSGRPRYVDALSIEIALLDYNKHKYESAAVVLSTCPSFYGSQGWNFIGYNLLVVFIDCLNYLDDKSDFFKGEESQTKNVWLCNCYLDLISNVRKELSDGKLSANFISADNAVKEFPRIKLQETIFYDASNLFEIEVVPFISSDGADVYFLDIVLKHEFKEELELKNLEVMLSNEAGQTFSFIHEKIKLHRGKNSFKFRSADIITGMFAYKSFTANAGSVVLTEIKNEVEYNIAVYPNPNSSVIDIKNSNNMKLSDKTVSTLIKTGVLDLQNSKLKIVCISSCFELAGEFKVINLNTGKVLRTVSQSDSIGIIGDFESNCLYEVIVPYEYNAPIPESVLDLTVQLEYTSGEKTYSQTVSKLLDTSLSIAVSVQDIFKSSSLYAKFSIGTADVDSQIRILSTHLSSNNSFGVCTSTKAEALVAFGELPGTYFYRIEKKQNGKVPECDKFLTLDIVYDELKEEIQTMLFSDLETELSDKRYLCLLKQLFDELKIDLTHFAIYCEVKVSNADEILGSKLFDSVDPRHREETKQIFFKVITNKQRKDLRSYSFLNRHLYIDVEVPTVEVIHTLEFDLERRAHYIVGEPIDTSFRIKSLVEGVINKDEPVDTSKKRVAFKSEISPIHEYLVEILSNQDSWLLNGKTKLKLTINKNEENKVVTFPQEQITLIPLKFGKLALPKIKVTNLTGEGKNDYIMEIDYKNDSETVNVVSDRILS